MSIRNFEANDIEPLIKILQDTKVFKEKEVEVARELMEICVKEPFNKDYRIAVYEDNQKIVRGYYCVGPTPMTEATYDMYWIAVDSQFHDRGLGKQLLKHCERTVADSGGKLIVVETSSQPRYEHTRLFYVRNNYHESGRLKDYYADGDDLVIYTKNLREAL